MCGSTLVKVNDIHQAIPTINHLIRANATIGSSTTIATSGGQTPIPLYEDWLHNDLPFREFTNIVLTDERYVNRESPESNFGNCWTNWKTRSNTYKLISINTSSTLEECAAQYESELLLLGHNDNRAIDIAILGIGEDGHTASIFPGVPVVECPHRLVGYTHHPSTGQPRITLTERFLFSTKSTIVLCFGETKRSVLQRILSPDCELLIARILRKSTSVLFSNLL